MEIWDAYYSDGSLAGKDLVRGEKSLTDYFTLYQRLFLNTLTAVSLLCSGIFQNPIIRDYMK